MDFALDDLDLDGMFADDGDMLFEGLDIELDGTIGDIMSNGNTQSIARPPAAPPPSQRVPTPEKKRSGGPRTKRTNPMLEKPKTAGNEETTVTSPGNKRRKTKRKSKAPAAFGDDEEGGGVVEEQQQPPKKKRKSNTKTKKTTDASAVTTAKTKRKKITATASVSLTKGSTPLSVASSILPKSTKVSMGPPPVAAAGQFGGRLKKAGTTKVKRKLKKSTDSTSDNAALAPAEVIKPPKPEPTYGGLSASNTLFYPFLESVPAESTMQKRKTYPIMDRISSTLTSQMLSGKPDATNPTSPGMTEDNVIFKLMHDTYEGNEKDKKNFTPEKRAALLKGIFHLRVMIKKAEKNSLVKDVFAMCGLLTREYNFLKQTLDNMKVWCKNEFDDEKYKETYEPPIEQPKITKWKCHTGIVRVKVLCTGFKEAKNSLPLYAMLPAIVFDAPPPPKPVPPPSAPAISKASLPVNEPKKSASATAAGVISPKVATTTVTKKKKKEKPIEKPKPKAVPTLPQVPAVPVPKTYADSTPIARRQQIVERVSQLALELESSQHKEKSIGRLDPVLEEQPPLHTTRMWDWLQSAGFYNKVASSKRLASIKSPQIHSRRPYQSIPTRILGHDFAKTEEEVEPVSSTSLFDRLQSLLVEEVSEDDEEEDDEEESLSFLDDDDDDVDDIESKIKAVEIGQLDRHTKFDVADMSELSTEERTFVHLSKAGLIKKTLYPAVELLISKNESGEENEIEGIDHVIGEMSTDLTRMTSMNNTRISYIERLTSDADVYYNKQVEDEQAVLIAKCQNLMKRTKEKAKKAKQKKDESLNLPW
uniref:Uncharacterized protein n=1 Tax=Pseudo-nitzschia australis TaxID=44445 RepID=A0A7S4A8X2_9STRA|mmetsp:Transcript_2471/g.5401  ORF Transcript_2471/g.5401 Transcript_2471/m.5401 type:complete len:816 (+) Transcript_2471:141-2588(+)|eukprot:CAMPEP_0168273648 /NCGR_PEP_ID=MMETSP0141_2-20121125/16852_1 /TAXON_ID=44445 /ORGANISM="Pseudo-nitzschia australis, Strain 10249 10 AB" /LENGTH=815 /DNA_ID=CAMNT_0008215133 /DNA_START=63 /DNA_END=2510 /DNA_ORIENTATION=-